MNRIKHGPWLGHIDNLAVYCLLAGLIILVDYLVEGDFNSAGAFIGTLTGTLMSGFYLLPLWRRARKKRFLIRANKGPLIVLLIAFIPIGLAGGYLYGMLKDKYPDIRIQGAAIAGMIFGWVAYSGLSLAGIHWLQHRYGLRFYIARTEQEAEEIISKAPSAD